MPIIKRRQAAAHRLGVREAGGADDLEERRHLFARRQQRRRCCNRGVTGFANDIPSYRIYNPDDLYCEVADVTTDGIASGGAGRRLQMDEPYLMSEAIDQLVEEFGGEDKILASIPYE